MYNPTISAQRCVAASWMWFRNPSWLSALTCPNDIFVNIQQKTPLGQLAFHRTVAWRVGKVVCYPPIWRQFVQCSAKRTAFHLWSPLCHGAYHLKSGSIANVQLWTSTPLEMKMSCLLAFQSISGGDPTIDLHNFRKIGIQNGQLTFVDCRVSAGKSRRGTNTELKYFDRFEKNVSVQQGPTIGIEKLRRVLQVNHCHTNK